MDIKVENSIKKGLLVLDFDGTLVNEDLIVFSDLEKILPELHEQGIEIVVLTAANWAENKTLALNKAFGEKRKFLTLPNDIYDVNRCSTAFFNGARKYTKGDALGKIAEERGYGKEIVVFVDDTKCHIDSAREAGFPALQVMTMSKYNPTPQDNFFNEILLQFCKDTFCLSNYFQKLDMHVIKRIGSFLPLRTSTPFYAINQLMWKEKSGVVFSGFIENFNGFCTNILSQIESYIEKFKLHCSFRDEAWRKDYGFVRALGFKIIFASPNHTEMGECAAQDFKLLALYLLLTEINGVNLKAQVGMVIPKNISDELKKHLLKSYQIDEETLAEGMSRLGAVRDSYCKQMHVASFSNERIRQGVVFASIFKNIHDDLRKSGEADREERANVSREPCIIS